MVNSTIVVDIGFGDSGKGTTVDYLTWKNKAELNVRFNGGAQAAHNVVTPSGIHHSFHQLGSGSFHGCDTYLSEYMIFDPYLFNKEYEEFSKKSGIFPKVFVNKNCLVATPYHWAANRIKEIVRGNGKHGSCGLGIGETVCDSLLHSDVLRVKDLEKIDILKEKLIELRARKIEEIIRFCKHYNFDQSNEFLQENLDILFDRSVVSEIASELFYNRYYYIITTEEGYDLISSGNNVVFEGAQGVLIDEEYGFHPYVTWSTTTFKNAMEILSHFESNITKVGVTRPYMARHGCGPLPTENKNYNEILKENHNSKNEWQGEMRFGDIDINLLNYSLDICHSVDYLTVTCMDHLSFIGKEIDSTVNFIEKELGTKIGLLSFGKTLKDKTNN